MVGNFVHQRRRNGLSECHKEDSETHLPSFPDMKGRIIYVPSLPNFPVGDIFFLDKGMLTAVNVTRQTNRVVDLTTVQKFLTTYNLDGSKLKIVICPPPRVADDTEIQFKENGSEAQKELKQQIKVEIWKLPRFYSKEDDSEQPQSSRE